MRTPKIIALHNLIDWLNFNIPDCDISKLPLDTSPLSSNSWLAGFTDGDGGFETGPSLETAKSYQRISISVNISQSRVDSALIEQYFNITSGGCYF
jgi:hypothetical protein